jgi:hypothetical protein
MNEALIDQNIELTSLLSIKRSLKELESIVLKKTSSEGKTMLTPFRIFIFDMLVLISEVLLMSLQIGKNSNS